MLVFLVMVKKIIDIASLEDASESEISFYNSAKYKHDLEKTKAGVVVVDKSFKIKSENEYLVVDDPYVAMAKIASMFYPDCEYQSFFDDDDLINPLEKPKKCSQHVFIHKNARIGKNCEIGSFVKIGPGVTIGDNCLIGDNVSIYYAKISSNVKIYQGVKIGGEGFGFISKKDFFKKIPQLEE